MPTLITTLPLLADLLVFPFLVGAFAAGALALITRIKRPWQAALFAGLACAIVHALGVMLLWWKDGDWLGYLVMALVAGLFGAFKLK